MEQRCSSILNEDETLIKVHCNSTNEEIIFNRPEEGTKQCIQVCKLLLRHNDRYILFYNCTW